MKKFKFLKGLAIGLLALAVAFVSIGAVKASAEGGTVKATFKATVDSKTYTYTADVASGTAATVAVAEILKGMKADKLVVADIKNASTSVLETKTEGDATVYTGNVKFTITEATEFTVTLVPEKVKVTFTDGTYTAEVEVANPAAYDGDEAVIAVADITAALKDSNKKAVPNKAITSIKNGETPVEIKNGKITLTAIPTGALAIEVKDAFTWNYDPAQDAIVFSEIQDGVTLYWYNIAKNDKKDVKGSQFNVIKADDIKDNKVVFPLYDKAKGVKVAENKGVYLFVTSDKPAEAKTTYAPNVSVKPTSWKKVTVNINYAWADPYKDGVVAIDSIVLTDSNKNIDKVLTLEQKLASLIYSDDEGKTWYPVLGLKAGQEATIGYECTTVKTGWTVDASAAKGYGDVKLVEDSVVAQTGFKKADGTTVPAEELATFDTGITITKADDAEAYDGAFTIAEVKDNRALDLAYLYKLISGTDKPKFQFKYIGADYTTPDKNDAVRNAKVVKVTGKTMAKAAKSVKVNLANSTIAVKNGYDYAVMTVETDPAVYAEIPETGAKPAWYSVLPCSKDGKAANAVVLAGTVTPAKAKDNANVFTTTKVTGLYIPDLYKDFASAEKIIIYVRKSAAPGKPAQNYTKVEINKVTAAPVIEADKDNSAIYATADSKGKFTVPNITNAEGDTNAAEYEFAVVNKADYDGNKIVWTSVKWTKLVVGKTIAANAKTKYMITGADKADSHECKTDGSTYILVRRKGDKASGNLASNWVVTVFVKTTATNAEGQSEEVIQWKPVLE